MFKPVSSKLDVPSMEEGVLNFWERESIFRKTTEQRTGRPEYVFFEGPPTANGRPGVHHVLARGFHVSRRGGWDTHGLPVEIEVEKMHGFKGKQQIEEYGIAKFNEECRKSAFEYIRDWAKLTDRIGFWVDLEDAYVTYTDEYIESVWSILKSFWEKDLLYKRYKVVPYCPRCGTALSSHEVALGYEDVSDPSIYVKFPLLAEETAAAPERRSEGGSQSDSSALAGAEEAAEFVLVWTTTPWTLPGNVAVAVAPEVTYVRAKVEDETLILAEPLVERVLGEGAEIVGRLQGRELVGRRYKGPVFNLSDRKEGGFPILAGDFVTTEDGTGLVHIAPAFGEDDYAVAAENGIFDPSSHGTLYNPVRLDGTFTSQVTGFEGRFVKDPEVTRALIDDLGERGLLFREQVYEHAYPHCWRCGTPLLYYAMSSWYIATSHMRDRLLANNEEVGWHPQHIKHGRFGKWLESNVDWALSRDRYWGTPLPIWECGADDCEGRFCAGSVAELRERARGEVPDDLHRPYIDGVTLDCERCGGEMHRVESVIDTWYDSGAMPFAQFHFPFENEELFEERFPADFICEAIDQTRGWFYTLLAESTLLFDTSSYRNCVCLGLILDPEGQKMSKSRGNVVEPWDVISAHGADAFRWYYLTAQQPWAGYRFSVNTVGESVRQFLLTLWNTYSFWVLYANAEGLTPKDFPAAPSSYTATSSAPATPEESDMDPASLPRPGVAGEDLDRWVLSRLQGTIGVVRERMDDFDCTAAGREIAEFVEKLSNWYVRLSRRRFWEGDRAAFATLRHCLLETAALLAPFTPFLADEIHLNLAGGEKEEFGELPDSVHLRDFPQADAALADAELEAAMQAVRLTVELGRAARAQAKVKVRQPLRRAVIVANDAEREAISARAELVRSELNVRELDFVSEEAELVSYAVKPNYRSLGPRFGKRMPQVAAAVEALDPAHVAAALSDGGEVGINVDGDEHTLTPEDVTLALQPLEGYEVEAEAGHAVALQLELDDELRREGLAREIVHAVQGARKDAGLEITDRIELTLGGDEELLAAAREHQPYIAGEVLATSVDYDGGGGATARIEGRELRIAISLTADG